MEETPLLEHGSIDTLPDEILSAIFLFNASKRLVGEVIAYDPYSTTVSTILVCRRWYMVGMSYPALWSQIIDYERHQEPCVKELLRRSNPTLLDVGEDSAFRHVQLGSLSILEHIFEQAARIRTMNLRIRIKPWNLMCKNFLQNPAPSLEFLNLITVYPFPDCLFPGLLFADSAPRLRRLHLRRCLIDFSSVALYNLTELSISDILPPGILSQRRPDHPLKVAPTAAGWIDIIKNMPSLMYLTLSYAITPSIDFDSIHIPTIHLPTLVFLSVAAKFRDGVTFLCHLSIPTTCGLRLKLSCDKSSPSLDGTKLFSVLGNQLAHWSEHATDRYLQAKILSGNRIHFGNCRRVGYMWDMPEAAVIEEHSNISSDPLLWLVLSLDSLEDTVALFNQLLSLYHETYTTTTTLDLWLDEEFEEFAVIHRSLPIQISFDILNSFSALLSLNLLEASPLCLLPLLQSKSLPDKPLLPSLRCLRLTRTDFEEQYAAYLVVIDFLAYRTEHLSSLREVQIIDGNISPEAIDYLERISGVQVSLGT